MLNWFLTSWNESNSFRILACVVAAAFIAFLISDRRSSILRPIANLVSWLFMLPIRAVQSLVELANELTSKPPVLLAPVTPPTQQELRDWIDQLRPGCVVSNVEEIGDKQVVHKGTVDAIKNDQARIRWFTEIDEHPFTSGPGPDGKSKSDHNIELILKEHNLGDRGVTWDSSGVVLVANGWSVISWPKFERPTLLALSS